MVGRSVKERAGEQQTAGDSVSGGVTRVRVTVTRRATVIGDRGRLIAEASRLCEM
jgi:transcription antitermination factor NusA-like protein